MIGLITLLSTRSFGQDFHFTQFYADKLYLSPSFAGATAENRVISNYRNQWLSLTNGKGYVTYSLSYDRNFPIYSSGVGILIMDDNSGSTNLNYLEASLAYSFDFMIDEDIHLRPGASFSFLNTSIDYNNFNWGEDANGVPLPGLTPPSKSNSNAVDATVSTLAYNKQFWGGITIDHLLEPNVSIWDYSDRLPLKFTFFGGITIIRNGRLLRPIDETLSLALLASLQQNNNEVDLGIYWAKSPLTMGLWYRRSFESLGQVGDALAVLIGVKMQYFSFGYSYDFPISGLLDHTSGTHELSLTYEFVTVRKKKMQSVPCPEF